MKRLSKSYPETFFSRPTVEVARDLLGITMNRRLPSGEVLTAIISEVEAYAQDDPASHCYKGQTKRCQVMFGPPGRAYVYFIYGMYYCLNVVTEKIGTGGAVLIRGLLAEGLDGPGKICRQWQIDQSFNGTNLLDPSANLWLSPPQEEMIYAIQSSPRIGISKAREKMWRFYIQPVHTKDISFKKQQRWK